jgi:rSAM/selenodomain-associated transferase 1
LTVDNRQGAELLVFLKAPRPGRVKTRLAAAVGEAAAAGLYRALAEQVLRATASEGEYERWICFDPPDAGEEIRAWLGEERLLPQSSGDLGARMAHAFAGAFTRGAARVAVIGSDAPAVSRARVREALDGLGGQDVVLGPARDGGYYLIALDRPRPELFQAVPWSTAAVLAATRERAAALGLRLGLLPLEGDVDTLEDLRREWPRLEPRLGAALVEALRPAVTGSSRPRP